MQRELGTPDQRLDALYSFLQDLYPANWQVRFGGAPHMSRFAQQADVDGFVEQKGPFESLAGHTWMLAMTSDLIREMFPGLRSCINWPLVNRLILYHDAREVTHGDFSAFRQLSASNGNKENESKEWARLTSILPTKVGEDLFRLCEDFESDGEAQPLEMRFVRFIDDLQAGNCVLKFGTCLEENSETANKISRKRVVLWARELIDALKESGHDSAAREVTSLIKYHVFRFRSAGINLQVSDLGFDF